MSSTRARTRPRHRARARALVALAAAATAALGGATPASAAVSWSKGKLAGATSERPTALQWGPDGRLYVGQQNGLIKAYTVDRTAPGAYKVAATETITTLNAIPNHNDDGTVCDPAVVTLCGQRLLTGGLLVTGTAQAPVIYAATSDPRIAKEEDVNLDTNSGVVSRLTKGGGGWGRQDLVRGLPRSEENHGPNGLALSADGGTLYLAEGGNTNNGGPSKYFGDTPEYALSAAVLSIDLGGLGSPPYDIPTLDDPKRPGAADANDPFGGNDGDNQAKLVAGGPVQVHAPGMRNAYDVVVTKAGRIFTVDNGGNSGLGGGPVGDCTNAPSPGGTTNLDELFEITAPGTYGGHPNPTRGNPVGNGWPGVVPAANPMECELRTEVNSGSLMAYKSSTNGIAEYTASNFGGELQGELLMASLNNSIQRYSLKTSTGKALITNAGGSDGILDVTAQGDEDAYPGTVWFADIYASALHVLEPTDYDGTPAPECGTGSDADGDGYTNDDENTAGSEPCDKASTPPDFDGDKVSDRTDADDDGDGLNDKPGSALQLDPFAWDPDNGLTTQLPVHFPWENDTSHPRTIADIGFTGLMTNHKTDYLDMFDVANMTRIAAVGAVVVDEVDAGDASDGNGQKYGFQVGFDARPQNGPFTVRTRVMEPFRTAAPVPYQSMGVFFGTGDQSNYVKLVTSSTGLELFAEVGDKGIWSRDWNVQFSGLDAVDLFLHVDPATASVSASYSTVKDGTSSAIKVLPPLALTAEHKAAMLGWFTQPDRGVAAGIISTSNSGDVHTLPTPFTAAWDAFFVTKGAPTTQQPEGPGTGTGTPGTGTPGTGTPGTGTPGTGTPGTGTPGTGGSVTTPPSGGGTVTTPPSGGGTGTTPGTPPAQGTIVTPDARPDRTAPVLRDVRLSRSTFRTRGAQRGTTVRLTLSEAARVRLTVQKAVTGRAVGGSCVKPTSSNRRAAACVRWVAVAGSSARDLVAGPGELAFTGRLEGRVLGAGRHRMVLTATDAAGNRSAATRVAFRVTG